ARNQQGGSAAGPGIGIHPALRRTRAQRRRLRRQGIGAAALRLPLDVDMRAPLSLLPLRLENVVFEVGSRRIVDGISLTLDRGARTIVLGPNGAGKSVLLRLCHGLLQPTSGTIEWNSVELPGGPR